MSTLKTSLARYEDPEDPLNSANYHTGKRCIEPGCDNPAGTHWSPFWCQACNAKRLKRITTSMAVTELASLVKDVRPAGGVTITNPPLN